ncbi:MAG: hypothetical protein ABEI86_06790 [Halobacteriaceae archaeon]
MPDIGKEVTTQLTFGPPKNQATIPVEARKVLECDDLDEDQKAIVEAKLILQKVESKD